MAILKIARMGHPVLLQKAQPVPDPTSPDIRRLVADMIETLEDANGAGLAAPQVHVPLRLFLFRVPALRASGAEDDRPTDMQVVVNPELEPDGEQTSIGWEGCLSIPGMQAEIARPAAIAYRGLDGDGVPFARRASGFHARVVQHETDHLDGILYTMRLTDLSRFGFNDEVARFGARP